jgi:hypothetical protein
MVYIRVEDYAIRGTRLSLCDERREGTAAGKEGYDDNGDNNND